MRIAFTGLGLAQTYRKVSRWVAACFLDSVRSAAIAMRYHLDQARNRLLALKERLDNKADFAELARARSDDTSASRGGDLNWLSPGDTVPEFEQAMNALKPGEISAPVRSPFGWHLIQVLERRSQDVTKEGQRMNARQTLRERKTDEAYQEWVRQLRDRAYVEQRLENRS